MTYSALDIVSFIIDKNTVKVKEAFEDNLIIRINENIDFIRPAVMNEALDTVEVEIEDDEIDEAHTPDELRKKFYKHAYKSFDATENGDKRKEKQHTKAANIATDLYKKKTGADMFPMKKVKESAWQVIEAALLEGSDEDREKGRKKRYFDLRDKASKMHDEKKSKKSDKGKYEEADEEVDFSQPMIAEHVELLSESAKKWKGKMEKDHGATVNHVNHIVDKEGGERYEMNMHVPHEHAGGYMKAFKHVSSIHGADEKGLHVRAAFCPTVPGSGTSGSSVSSPYLF